MSGNPLDALPFPVKCQYPGCDAGPFVNGDEVDEHISEEHLTEAVWLFATENMREVNNRSDAGVGEQLNRDAVVVQNPGDVVLDAEPRGH